MREVSEKRVDHRKSGQYDVITCGLWSTRIKVKCVLTSNPRLTWLHPWNNTAVTCGSFHILIKNAPKMWNRSQERLHYLTRVANLPSVYSCVMSRKYKWISMLYLDWFMKVLLWNHAIWIFVSKQINWWHGHAFCCSCTQKATINTHDISS